MLKLCSPAQTSQESSENMGQLAPSTKGHHFGPEVLHGSTCSPVCAPRAHITQGFGIGQNAEYAIDGSTSCETFVNASMGQLRFQSQTPGHSSGDALTEPLSGMEEDVERTPVPKPNVGHKRVTQKINALSEQDSVRITDEQTPKERGKDEQRYWRGDKAIDIRVEQMADPFCKQMRNLLLNGILPESKIEAKKLILQRHSFCFNEAGCLCRVDIPTESGSPPIVLPGTMIPEVVKYFHDRGGHRKFQKAYELIREKFWFLHMAQYISDYCRTCDRCQKSKRTKGTKPPLGTSHIGHPNVTIHIDATKGVENNNRGYTHILAIVDAFTGYLTLFPLKQVNTRVIADCLLKYVTLHSMPLEIVTDGGPEFRKQLLKDLMENWGIHHSKISAYNHKGNGKVETIHGAFTLQFGRAPTYPIDITLQTSNPELVTPDEYAKMVHERMAEIFQIVNEKRQESEEKRVIDYNAMHSTQVFEKGQYVLLLEHQRKEQFNQKFAQRTQEDVFLVEEVISEQTYKIKNTKTGLILKNFDPGRGHRSIQYQITEERERDRKLEYRVQIRPRDEKAPKLRKFRIFNCC
mmetsp:Transcript_43300/g.60774  ORF Transcript_43300/g.60774 Transcript_43300/m.60774 type:complete len:577 (+) Transcript_43300:212-1942(+)